GVRFWSRSFGGPVDPDRGKSGPACRRDVVKEARADVDVPRGVGAGPSREFAPVAESGLVRADLARHDRLGEGDAEQLLRGGDVVGVRVREDGELPAPSACLLEGGPSFGKRLPAGQ